MTDADFLRLAPPLVGLAGCTTAGKIVLQSTYRPVVAPLVLRWFTWHMQGLPAATHSLTCECIECFAQLEPSDLLFSFLFPSVCGFHSFRLILQFISFRFLLSFSPHLFFFLVLLFVSVSFIHNLPLLKNKTRVLHAPPSLSSHSSASSSFAFF